LNNKPKIKRTNIGPPNSRVIWMDFECIVGNYDQIKLPVDGLLDWQIWIWKKWVELYNAE